jgi:hypothetical protein
MNNTAEYIDLTPTWQEQARMLIVLLEEGDAKGRKTAREEIMRMAKVADAYVASQKAAQPAPPATMGERLMPGCTCGAAAEGNFDRCRCD